MDWLFPPVCASCGQPGARWCERCAQQTKRVELTKCTLCGNALPLEDEAHVCSRTGWLDQAYAWGKYQFPVSKAIQRLKYSRDVALGDTLSKLLFQVCQERNLRPDLVVPVPLSRQRRQARGYNQAALLARPLAWMLGVPYSRRLVRKVRDTASQVGLSIEKRKHNMAGAFRADETGADGKVVLVVDDVLTTGATLDAVAHALKEAGAKKVVGLVVGRA